MRLDGVEELEVPLAYERDGDALAAHPGRPADAVDVLLDALGDVVIDDVGHRRHVDAARGEVRRHQQLELAVAEVLHHRVAFALRQAAVDRLDPDAPALEGAHEPVHVLLRPSEHERLLVAVEHFHQRRQLVPARHLDVPLLHLLDRFRLLADAEPLRFPEVRVDQPPYLRRDRRREEGGLARAGRRTEDTPDVRQETDVQHLVSLVQHHHAGPVEPEHVTVEQVDHPAGSADHDGRAVIERLDLRAEARSAVDGDYLRAAVLAQLGQLPRHLARELPRRRQHDRLHVPLAGVDQFRDRDAEPRRLACAGLRLPDEVQSTQERVDDEFLDGGRRLVAHLFERAGHGSGDHHRPEGPVARNRPGNDVLALPSARAGRGLVALPRGNAGRPIAVRGGEVPVPSLVSGGGISSPSLVSGGGISSPILGGSISSPSPILGEGRGEGPASATATTPPPARRTVAVGRGRLDGLAFSGGAGRSPGAPALALRAFAPGTGLACAFCGRGGGRRGIGRRSRLSEKP